MWIIVHIYAYVLNMYHEMKIVLNNLCIELVVRIPIFYDMKYHPFAEIIGHSIQMLVENLKKLKKKSKKKNCLKT